MSLPLLTTHVANLPVNIIYWHSHHAALSEQVQCCDGTLLVTQNWRYFFCCFQWFRSDVEVGREVEEVRGSTGGSDGDSTEHGGETREPLSHRLPQPRDVRQNPEHGRHRSPQTRGNILKCDLVLWYTHQLSIILWPLYFLWNINAFMIK